MKQFTNNTPGARGINVKDRDAIRTVLIEVGQTVEIDPKTIVGAVPDLGSPKPKAGSIADHDAALAEANKRADDAQAALAASQAEAEKLRAQLAALDRDGDGRPGGSTRQDPPALTGKNKADLLLIAKSEGVEVDDSATNAEIVSAIEAKRLA